MEPIILLKCKYQAQCPKVDLEVKCPYSSVCKKVEVCDGKITNFKPIEVDSSIDAIRCVCNYGCDVVGYIIDEIQKSKNPIITRNSEKKLEKIIKNSPKPDFIK